ncbi:hypothetical protein D3C79_698090 [compost metagenome]
MIGQDLCAMLAGIEHIGGGQAEWVDGTIRHPHGADQRRVSRRLQAQRELRINGFGVDAGTVARGDKLLLVGQRILRQGNE